MNPVLNLILNSKNKVLAQQSHILQSYPISHSGCDVERSGQLTCCTPPLTVDPAATAGTSYTAPVKLAKRTISSDDSLTSSTVSCEDQFSECAHWELLRQAILRIGRPTKILTIILATPTHLYCPPTVNLGSEYSVLNTFTNGAP